MDFLTQQFIAAAKHLREEVAALRESINTLRDQQERQYQEQQAQRKLPQPPIGVEAEIHEKPHAEGENQSYRKKTLRVQWITAIATSLAFIAAAIYAGVAASQLRVMRRQLGEIIRQYPEFQKSADAAKESADAAKEAADTARNQFELTKKQVVAVVTFTGVERDDPRNSTEIDVRFTNTGHVISEPSNVTLEVLYTNLDGTQSMTKSERYSFVIPQLKPPSGQIPDVWSWKHKLKVPLVLNFRDDATVRVTGTIVGSDGFGHKVPTPFCVSYIPYAHIEAEHEGVQMIGDYFADCREFRDSITKIRKYALVE